MSGSYGITIKDPVMSDQKIISEFMTVLFKEEINLLDSRKFKIIEKKIQTVKGQRIKELTDLLAELKKEGKIKYEFDIQVYYTTGKKHSTGELYKQIWPNKDYPVAGDVCGEVRSAYVTPEKSLARGLILIDLDCAVKSAMRDIVKRRLNPTPQLKNKGIRAKVFLTLAHELFHLIQGWVDQHHQMNSIDWKGGNVKWRGKKVDNASYRTHKNDIKKLTARLKVIYPMLSEAALEKKTYRSRPYEVEAVKMAAKRLSRVSGNFNTGKWDTCIPSKIIRDYSKKLLK